MRGLSDGGLRPRGRCIRPEYHERYGLIPEIPSDDPLARLDRALLPLLNELQRKYGYLPLKELDRLSEGEHAGLEEILRVVGLHPSLRLLKPGIHRIAVCSGPFCLERGSTAIVNECERLLGIRTGESTWDGRYTLMKQDCFGLCLFAPVFAIDDRCRLCAIPEEVASSIRGIAARAPQPSGAATVARSIVARCPHCRSSLMDSSCLIDGFPSILVTGIVGHTQGWIRLSSVYSSYHVESEFPADAGTIMSFYCPVCSEKLAAEIACSDCGAPMVFLAIAEETNVSFCSRRGCRAHHLEPRSPGADEKGVSQVRSSSNNTDSSSSPS